MNRTAPAWSQALLTMTLIGIAAGLATRAGAAGDEPSAEPLLFDGLNLSPSSERLETFDTAAESVTSPDVADLSPGRVRFSLGKLNHLQGIAAPRPAHDKGLAFGIGPQLLETGNPAERLASDLYGDSLLERHRYALIGFAGYRGYRGWAVGPEAWVNAGPSYRIRGLGLAVRDLRAGPLRMDLRLGATRQPDQARAINGGVEFRWYKP